MTIITKIPPASTSQFCHLRALSTLDGTPVTGITTATAGLDLRYQRLGGVAVSLTEVNRTLGTAWASGSLAEVGNGIYEIGVPDAALVAGSPGVMIYGSLTNVEIEPCFIRLDLSPLDELVIPNFTLRQLMRLFDGALSGKKTGEGTGTIIFRDSNDTKDRIIATLDANGNRIAITRDVS